MPSQNPSAESKLRDFFVARLDKAIAKTRNLPSTGQGRSRPRQAAVTAEAARLVAYDVTILRGPGVFEHGGLVSGARSQLMSERSAGVQALRRAAELRNHLDREGLDPEQARTFEALHKYADWIQKVCELLVGRSELCMKNTDSMAQRRSYVRAMQVIEGMRSQEVLALDLVEFGGGGDTYTRSWVSGVRTLQEMLSEWQTAGWRYMKAHSKVRVPKVAMSEVRSGVRLACGAGHGADCLCAEFDEVLMRPEPERLRDFALRYAEVAGDVNAPVLEGFDDLESARRPQWVFYWRVHQFLMLRAEALETDVPAAFTWQFPQTVHVGVGGVYGLAHAAREASGLYLAASGPWTTRGHRYIDDVWRSWGGGIR